MFIPRRVGVPTAMKIAYALPAPSGNRVVKLSRLALTLLVTSAARPGS